MSTMLRRTTLPILVVYGLWIAWAVSLVAHELDMFAANPKSLAFAIAIRECGYHGGDLMRIDCGARTFKEVTQSIGEPSIWAAWRLRNFYAGFIFVPPMWFVSKAIIGVALCYLCMIAWRLVRPRRARLKSSPALREWRASRDRHWPLNNAAASRKN